MDSVAELDFLAGPGCVEGWRDPFVVTTMQSGTSYRMLLGSGYHRDGKKNGCVLQYSATDVAGPWRYDGVVAEGDFQHGRVWECPALVQVASELSGCVKTCSTVLQCVLEVPHRGHPLLLVDCVRHDKYYCSVQEGSFPVHVQIPID